MPEFLVDLQWLDWVALTLLAYGVVAGAFRGTVHQFSRLVVLLLSLVIVGLVSTPLLALLSSAAEQGSDSRLLGARLGLGLFVVVWPGLTVLRRLLLGEGPGARGWAGRVGGALGGALAALILATVAGCAGYWIQGGKAPVYAQSSVVGRVVTEAAGHLPAPPRPAFLVPQAFPA